MRYRERVLKQLTHRAASPGYTLHSLTRIGGSFLRSSCQHKAGNLATRPVTHDARRQQRDTLGKIPALQRQTESEAAKKKENGRVGLRRRCGSDDGQA